MLVIANAGEQVPIEGKPREYITDKEAVEVPDTHYYRRLVTDGSLTAAAAPKPKTSGGNK